MYYGTSRYTYIVLYMCVFWMQLHINLAASGVNPSLQLTSFMLGKTIKLSLLSLTPSANLFGPYRLYNARGESVSLTLAIHTYTALFQLVNKDSCLHLFKHSLGENLILGIPPEACLCARGKGRGLFI